MDWNAATPLLQAKLDPANVKPAKAYGPKGDYIEGWHAMAEANRIFGFGEWSYTVSACQCVSERPREIGKNKTPGFGVTYTATVRIDVGGVIREDVGAGHGYDVDCGLAHESAIKEAVTDALKRALRGFGNPFGLALYDKTRENVGAPTDPEREHAAATEADALCKSLSSAKDEAELGAIWEAEAAARKRVFDASPAQYDRVKKAASDRKHQLAQKEAA